MIRGNEGPVAYDLSNLQGDYVNYKVIKKKCDWGLLGCRARMHSELVPNLVLCFRTHNLECPFLERLRENILRIFS